MAKYTLVGVDSNAFPIMAYVKNAMKKEGRSKEEINNYLNKAMSSDYDNLLAESIRVVDELNAKYEDDDSEDCTGRCSECSNREQCEKEDEENEYDI